MELGQKLAIFHWEWSRNSTPGERQRIPWLIYILTSISSPDHICRTRRCTRSRMSISLQQFWSNFIWSSTCKKQFKKFTLLWTILHAQIQRERERERGVCVRTPPWKITIIMGFLAILVQISWTITKLPSQHSMLGHYQPAFETPFVLLAGRWWLPILEVLS